MQIFKPADILLPKQIDFTKWSVVACDQYTSEPEYWEEAGRTVGEEPSTLHLIFPEVYLEEEGGEERIARINKQMQGYLDTGLFETLEQAFIYVVRTQRDGRVRHGIVGAIDLEAYDFTKGSQSPVRATEGTILERIPPRQRIRAHAPLELPHILVLIDDQQGTVVEPLQQQIGQFEKLYDFDLMMDSGHLTGYRLDKIAKQQVLKALEELSKPETLKEKYGQEKQSLVYAIGDGNHSLATAKTCWEELKKTLSPEQQQNHPARFALVELMNVYDEALQFEPIQRVVFEVEPQKLLSALKEYYPGASEDVQEGQCIRYVYGGQEGAVYIKNAPGRLAVGTLQQFLDDYLKKNGGRVDYIHGDDVVRRLAEKPGNIGFFLPNMEKTELFQTVLADGALPRKTFSMGEAEDKRFYCECKKI